MNQDWPTSCVCVLRSEFTLCSALPEAAAGWSQLQLDHEAIVNEAGNQREVHTDNLWLSKLYGTVWQSITQLASWAGLHREHKYTL